MLLPKKARDFAKSFYKHDESQSDSSKITQELYKRNVELSVRNKTLALLRQLDEISLEASKVQDLAHKMAVAIALALSYDIVSIAMIDKNERKLQWIGIGSSVPWITAAIKEIGVSNVKLSTSNRAASLEVTNGSSRIFVDDPALVYPKDFIETLRSVDETPEVHEMQHSMLYPLRYGGKTLGILTLSSSRKLKNLSRYEQEAVGGIIGLVSLAMYKTDLYVSLQETSAKLASANKQLQNLDKAKSEFLSIASHQLYTPLTALRGYVSMLEEGDFGKVPEKQKPILDILDQSAQRLISLIKGLLDISRIERGKFELNLESTDLVKMAKDLVEDLLPNAISKGLKLEFHSPKEPVANVVVDKDRIRQILLNFVDNAIKYTPEGNVDVYVEQQGDAVLFFVKDTGKGISKDDLAKLFQKFSRVGGAARFHTQGTGLGLYVAQQIVGEHKGEVRADSPGEGKGSTFTLTLPAEGTARSLKVGDKAEVEIKAAETAE